MPAPKGHAPYPGCETGGRPRKYSIEDIESFADELLNWIKNEENYWVKDFCLERTIDPDFMSQWAKENEKFSGAYKIAKNYQESRIFKGSMQEKYNSSMSKFALASNHGWTDRTATTLSGDPVNPLGFVLQDVDGKTKELVNDKQE